MPIKIVKKPKASASAINCTSAQQNASDPLGYGQRAVDFLRSLKHPKSQLPGQGFQLDPWQEDIVRKIYGPRHPDGSRIVKTVVLLLPRGNRKTSLGAALALLHTMGPEAIPGGEALFAAADRKQAKLAFRESESIIRAGSEHLWTQGQASRRFDRKNHVRLREYVNRIDFPNGAFLEALSSDAGTQHGRTPCFVLADELHAWPKRDLWDALKSGLVKVPNSLLIVVTTAGRGQENLAYDIVEDARRVARGEVDDPSILPILYEASKDDDWKDETVWRKVNPGLACGYPDIHGLRQLAKEADRRPGEKAAFLQFNLNVWADHSTSPFVDMAIYDQGAKPVDLDALRNQPCWLGVDLSSTDDLTVIVAAWRDGEG